MSVAEAIDILMNAVEQTLSDEQQALLGADAEALLESCQSKQRALQELDSVCGASPAQRLSPPQRTRLRGLMVANVRNQILLAVLQTRLDERMQRIGMLDETYGRNGKRGRLVLRTSSRHA